MGVCNDDVQLSLFFFNVEFVWAALAKISMESLCFSKPCLLATTRRAVHLP